MKCATKMFLLLASIGLDCYVLLLMLQLMVGFQRVYVTYIYVGIIVLLLILYFALLLKCKNKVPDWFVKTCDIVFTVTFCIGFFGGMVVEQKMALWGVEKGSEQYFRLLPDYGRTITAGLIVQAAKHI